jgi:hypothetical protein
MLVLALGIASGLGFWAGTQWRKRDLLGRQELRAQRESLARLEETVAELVHARQGTQAPRLALANVGPVLDKASLESAVRTALDAKDREAQEQQATANQPTTENLKAFAEGERLVSDAITARKWTERDKLMWIRTQGRLTGEQYMELMQRLISAINTQTLTIQTDGPAF